MLVTYTTLNNSSYLPSCLSQIVYISPLGKFSISSQQPCYFAAYNRSLFQAEKKLWQYEIFVLRQMGDFLFMTISSLLTSVINKSLLIISQLVAVDIIAIHEHEITIELKSNNCWATSHSYTFLRVVQRNWNPINKLLHPSTLNKKKECLTLW